MKESTRTLLEQHFEAAFAAPDGITKLRELILTLAMQGKLVEQDPNDLPASALLKEIEAERKRMVKAGKIKQSKPLPPIKREEIPFELPLGWEWMRLGDICSYIQRGKGPKYVDFSTHRVISQKCVRWYGLDLEPARYIDPASLQKYQPIRFLRVGDLLWNSTGTGTIGRACLVPEELEGVEIVADSHVTVVRTIKVSPVFLWRWIQGPTVQNGIEGSASGTTNQIELNTSTVINYLIPLPPLPEQSRIVARIDQLMARCDELERLQKERQEKRLAVHAAAIKQLLDAPDGSAWDFIQQHFGELYTVKENVAELRKAILQLAVMGRLVPQDPNDPPASELLKEIEAEKKRLVKAGRIRQPKPLQPIKPEEVPYELPDGWEWVRLGAVMQFINGDRGKNYPSKDKLSLEGIPFISALNLSDGTISKDNLLCVSEAQYKKLGSGKLQKSDLVFCIRGSLGKKAIYPLDMGAIASSLVILRRFIDEEAFLLFIDVYLSSPFLFDEIRRYDNGTAQPNLSASSFMLFLVPLPPLPEQHRIVTRMHELMKLCDSLDSQIDAASVKQTALLNAVMALV